MRDCKFIKNIVLLTKKYFFEVFQTHDIDKFKSFNQFFELYKFNKGFIEVQKTIKESREIRLLFDNVLDEIFFNCDQTFSDLVTLRFSSKNKNKKIGTLKHLNAHRDTWGSNILEQINWWFPIYDIKTENTIYILPNYFNKYVGNNSKSWSFNDYIKNKKNYPSSPTSSLKFDEKEKLIIKINSGDLLCFSGHHIHGSNIGKENRINLETRTVSLNDKNKYLVPKNLDCESKETMTRWFRNSKNGKNLKNFY